MEEMWPLPTDHEIDIETEGQRLKKIMDATREKMSQHG